MDLVKFQASLDAHTQALVTHSASIEKLIAASGGAIGGATTGEATAARGRGRPTAAESAKIAAEKAASAAATQTAPVTQSAQTAATTVTPTVTASTPVSGPLTHLALKDKFTAFAKTKGRDAIVGLLKEFGVTEFGKVPLDQLALFQDRLDGKPQTPVPGDDMANLLGL